MYKMGFLKKLKTKATKQIQQTSDHIAAKTNEQDTIFTIGKEMKQEADTILSVIKKDADETIADVKRVARESIADVKVEATLAIMEIKNESNEIIAELREEAQQITDLNDEMNFKLNCMIDDLIEE